MKVKDPSGEHTFEFRDLGISSGMSMLGKIACDYCIIVNIDKDNMYYIINFLFGNSVYVEKLNSAYDKYKDLV